MLSVLDDVLKSLPAMLDDPAAWDSLIVNRRKPTTYRVFRYLDRRNARQPAQVRPVRPTRGVSAPAPVARRIALLEGAYRMWVGFTPDLESANRSP